MFAFSQRKERQKEGAQQGQKGTIHIQEKEPQGRGEDKEQSQADEGNEAHTSSLDNNTPLCRYHNLLISFSCLNRQRGCRTADTLRAEPYLGKRPVTQEN